jgi:dihydrofolate reductase
MSRNKRRISQQKDLVFTDKHPRALLDDLRQEGFKVAILAGGSQINTVFAREDLIDEIHLTYVPQIFGTGLTLFSDSISMQLELIDFKQLGARQIFARYRVIREAMA